MATLHSKSTVRHDVASPAPQILQPEATNTNDGTCWHVFTSAARLVPSQHRTMFSFMVLARLLDSPHLRPEVLMSACDGAIVETACATDKWARQRGSAVLLPLLLLAAAVPVVAWAWQWATYFLVAVLAVAVVGAALYVDNLLCVRRRAGAQRRHEEYARQLRNLTNPADTLWRDVRGQDIAEYAVMLAVILVIVIGTIHMVGSNSNNVFSSVASSMQ